MPDRFRLLEEIFARAAGLGPAERAAYLDASCRGDAELRRRVQSLLDQDRDSAVRIAAGIGQAAALAAAEDGGLDEGTRIGAWRIEREIGRGGMGTVYLASRADEQFQRTIALKLVRGAVTPETLRRFLDERRILASLDHPNIARLLDGGATPDGLPYFVMEHVEGLPIDRFCDERTLAVKDRLRLFLQVCDAVQYAHARLVVHRDLKPGNVLVSRDAAVKLLDFGIAKLLAPDPASGEPLQTGVSALRMTPEYASPEQVRGATVTTAADVYSLGVMLYELLSGRRPHEVTGMTPAAIERTLSEDEPIRPSAAAPGPRDAKALTGDLDSIVMKALRKEPEQRYGSVEQLAEDIRRHLDGLPVRARRGTWRYRGLKFVRRNRWALAGAALLLAVVLGSAGALIVQSRRIATERDRAIAAERQALTEAATARQVSDFLEGLFEVTDPAIARGRDISARDLLEEGASRIRTELKGQPEVRARLVATMGRVHARLGLHESAASLLEDALQTRKRLHGETHPEVARALASLGALHVAMGESARAEGELEDALEMRRALLGPAHGDIVESLLELAPLRAAQGRFDEQLVLAREALAMAREVFGERHLRTAACLNALGAALHELGDYPAAEAAHRESLQIRVERLGEDHPEVSVTLNNLATVLERRGDYVEAERIHERNLALRRRLYGEEHYLVALTLNNLATVLKTAGRPAEAEIHQRQSLAMQRKLLGEEHPLVLLGLNNLANLRHDQGDYEGAERLHRQSLELHRRVLGPEHPEVASSLNNLAMLLWDKGEPARAEPLLRETLALDRKALGEEHPWIALDLSNLASVVRDMGRLDEAGALNVRATRMADRLLGPDNPDAAVYRREYGYWMVLAGRAAQGEATLRQALAILEKAYPLDGDQVSIGRSQLGESLLRQGRLREAEPLLVDGFEALNRLRQGRGGQVANARRRLVDLYLAMGEREKARSYGGLTEVRTPAWP